MTLTVAAGLYKKSNLEVPKSADPVKAIIKQSLFNYLDELVIGKTVVDLYSGSGNIGIEAVSRGATYAVLVENNYDAIKSINNNIKKLNISDKVEAEVKDVLKFIEHAKESFEIVFADPPYTIPVNHLLNTVNKIIEQKGLFIYFHKSSNTEILVKEMKLIRTKKFGKSSYSVYTTV